MIQPPLAYILFALFVLLATAEVSAFIFKIYNNRFYRIFHFIGGALVYLLFFNLTQNRLLSLVLVLVVGILWEIHEWVLWKFFLKKRVYKPEKKDTLDDLLMDFLGGLLFYIVSFK